MITANIQMKLYFIFYLIFYFFWQSVTFKMPISHKGFSAITISFQRLMKSTSRIQRKTITHFKEGLTRDFKNFRRK